MTARTLDTMSAPWRLVSNTDPSKAIKVGAASLHELPPEECTPSLDPRHDGACAEQANCPEPTAMTRRQGYGCKERTNLEYLQNEIRKARSEMRSGIKEYLSMSDGVAEHSSPGVPGFSMKSCIGIGVNNKRAALAHLRHQEIHMAEKVRS